MRSHHLDIAVPLYGRSPQELISVLQSIVDHTLVDFRLMVVNNGVGSELNDLIRVWSKDLKRFVYFRNSAQVGFASCVNMCAKHTDSEFFIMVHPQVEIGDDDWITKLTMPFKDRQAFMAGVDPYLQYNSTAPYAFDRNDTHLHRCLVAFRRPDPEEELLVTDEEEEPMRKTQAVVIDRGQRVYLCPSIRLAIKQFQGKPKLASRYKPKTETLIFR